MTEYEEWLDVNKKLFFKGEGERNNNLPGRLKVQKFRLKEIIALVQVLQ